MTLSRRFDNLRIELIRNKMSQGELALAMNKCDGYMSLRMTGKRPFTVDDIFEMARILDVPRDRWVDVFLPEK